MTQKYKQVKDWFTEVDGNHEACVAKSYMPENVEKVLLELLDSAIEGGGDVAHDKIKRQTLKYATALLGQCDAETAQRILDRNIRNLSLDIDEARALSNPIGLYTPENGTA